MLGKRPQWERLRAQKQAKLIISFVMPPTLRFWLLQFYYPIQWHSSQHQSDRVSSWEFLEIAPCILISGDKTLRLHRVLNKIANLTAQDKKACMHKLKIWNTFQEKSNSAQKKESMEQREMVKVEIWMSPLSFQTEHVETGLTKLCACWKTPPGVGILFEAVSWIRTPPVKRITVILLQ